MCAFPGDGLYLGLYLPETNHDPKCDISDKTYLDLPYELWELIFKFSIDAEPFYRTIISTALTNKFFHFQVLQGPTLSYLLKRGSLAELEMSKKMAAKMLQICNHDKQAVEISLKPEDEEELIEHEDVATIATCNYLRFIIKESNQTLFIRDPIIQLLAVSSQMLQELELGDCSHLTSQSIEAIAENCRYLKSITLHNMAPQAEMDASLEALAQKCTRLERVILDSAPLSDKGMAFIAAHAKQLQTLELSDTQLTDQGLLAISTLPNLSTLKLSEAGKFSQPSIFSHLGNCQNIAHFALFDYKVALDDHHLAILAQAWPYLNTLEIHQAGNLSESGMAALNRHCTSLKELTVDVFNLTENSLEAIINTVSNLNTLNFGLLSTTSLSEDDISSLLKKHSPNLCQLSNLNVINFDLLDELAAYFPRLLC